MPSTSSPLHRAADAIPPKLKPAVAVFLNVSLLALLHFLATPRIGADLEAVNRPLREPYDYSPLVAWKVVGVLSSWIGGWDATQASALSILSVAPALHYAYTYQPAHAPVLPTLGAVAGIELFSTFVPFAFLRGCKSSRRRGFSGVTRLAASFLAASVYQLCLQALSAKVLTTWLIMNGWSLQSVARTHDYNPASVLTKAALMLPVGWAAAEVIFAADLERRRRIRKNNDAGWIVSLWAKALSHRARRVVKRTLLVAAYQGAGAAVVLSQVVKGGEIVGAAGVGGAWAAATVVLGVILGWVGGA